MNLKPKFSLKGLNDSNRKRAERYFTGRTVPRQELKEAIEGKSWDQYSVIHYYGIGGIGKTRLQKEMMSEIEKSDSSSIIGHLNFEAPHLLHVEGALVELRKQLKDSYKVQFNWFDLACAVLWKKVNPQLSFQSSKTELPFINESTYLGELISLVDGLPFVQWVPKTMQFAQSIAGQFKKWKMSTDELADLVHELTSLQPFEIEERLPLFFAEDVRRFLKKRSGTPIIFIDTYEAISDIGRLQGTYNEKEEWVKELILQLPEVLWVIFGRERLYWDHEHAEWNEIITQTLIDPLSDLDADKFLIKEGVTDEAVRLKMIKVSSGLPYQLDLIMDTYELIKDRKVPETEDFSNSPTQIVNRLIRYLTLPEREVLKVLSFPRHWNETLFKNLIAKLSIGYPATAIDELSRFSFIDKSKTDQWDMHPIMRESFQSMIKAEQPAFYERIHRLVYSEYKELLDAHSKSLDAVSEGYLNAMAYHASKCKLTPSDERSLTEDVERFYQAGRYRLFTPLSEDLRKVQSSLTSAFSLAQMYVITGHVASNQGRFDFALDQFSIAEQQLSKADFTEHTYYDLSLRMKREAATIHIKRTSYEKARQLLLAACALEPHLSYTNLELVRVLLQLGKLENDSTNKVQAGIHYEKGFELVERFIQKEAGDAGAWCLKGALYEKKGEWLTSKRHLEQQEAYKSSIKCYEQAAELMVSSLPLEMEADRGLAWKRLAENYSSQVGMKNQTIHAFQTAISIYDGILARNSDYIEALVKKGHASVDYLCFLGKCGQYKEAEETFEMAIESFAEAIEKSNDQAAAHNRIASAHREMAIIYHCAGKEDLAKATFTKAIEESLLLSRRYPNYINAESTLQKIYVAIESTGLQLSEESQLK